MSKIPYTGKTPGARQPIRPVSTDPLAPAEESYVTQNPLLEDPDALAARLADSEDFVRRNRNLLLGILVVVVAAVAGAFGYNYWRTEQNTQAQNAMFKAVDYWETDSLNKAMKGDGKHPGLTKVANEYSGTKAGNLANFYAGVAALKEGKYQEAYNYLDKFSADDYLVQSRAYSLMGDAKLELNQPKEAAELYAKAADHNANDQFSPGYVLKEGIALETAKDNAGALKAYDRILNDYAASQEAGEARQRKAALAQ
ncbi:tetratricopeptide repeat protein [Hymenobacter ginsengisoli]|uniref:Tetratricopeptide repeat protein n=1 Tax=Hymenobacter ginsengisoli TaxID=1051626 RepID=A0ABP8QH08_9BACT|nr:MULTISPECIES: tetratricopeptide repeat protein [unclassified Hymenobacter]MBO2030183.1 cytochrome C biosynthesis protein [Hymenobacter sp. BT559]